MGVTLLFSLLKNHWQLAALGVSIAVGAGMYKAEHVLLLHTRTELAQDVALLREAKELGANQAAAAAKLDAQHKADSDAIQAQLTSAYQAHALTADALSTAVVRYEAAARGGCAVPGATPDSGGGTRAGAGTADPGPAATALGALVRASQHDADELKACQSFARSCGTAP